MADNQIDFDTLIKTIEEETFTCRNVHDAWPSDIQSLIEQSYDDSLDACRALQEKMLPDWIVHDFSQNSRSMGWSMVIVNSEGNYVCSHDGRKLNVLKIEKPGRAWLLAIIKAAKDIKWTPEVIITNDSLAEAIQIVKTAEPVGLDWGADALKSCVGVKMSWAITTILNAVDRDQLKPS